MTGLPQRVEDLLSDGRLERVPVDVDNARLRFGRAQQKLSVAQSLISVDAEVAYVVAYDALRIGVSAHMLAHGVRATVKPRAHEAVGAYAEAMRLSEHAREFQRVRRRRNKAEYDDIVVGRSEVEADVRHVVAILSAVAVELGVT